AWLWAWGGFGRAHGCLGWAWPSALPSVHKMVSPAGEGAEGVLAESRPGHARVLLLQGGFELGVAVRSEGGPIEGGLEPLAVRGTEPEFHRQPAFAEVRVRFQRET